MNFALTPKVLNKWFYDGTEFEGLNKRLENYYDIINGCNNDEINKIDIHQFLKDCYFYGHSMICYKGIDLKKQIPSLQTNHKIKEKIAEYFNTDLKNICFGNYKQTHSEPNAKYDVVLGNYSIDKDLESAVLPTIVLGRSNFVNSKLPKLSGMVFCGGHMWLTDTAISDLYDLTFVGKSLNLKCVQVENTGNLAYVGGMCLGDKHGIEKFNKPIYVNGDIAFSGSPNYGIVNKIIDNENIRVKGHIFTRDGSFDFDDYKEKYLDGKEDKETYKRKGLGGITTDSKKVAETKSPER